MVTRIGAAPGFGTEGCSRLGAAAPGSRQGGRRLRAGRREEAVEGRARRGGRDEGRRAEARELSARRSCAGARSSPPQRLIAVEAGRTATPRRRWLPERRAGKRKRLGRQREMQLVVRKARIDQQFPACSISSGILAEDVQSISDGNIY